MMGSKIFQTCFFYLLYIRYNIPESYLVVWMHCQQRNQLAKRDDFLPQAANGQHSKGSTPANNWTSLKAKLIIFGFCGTNTQKMACSWQNLVKYSPPF